GAMLLPPGRTTDAAAGKWSFIRIALGVPDHAERGRRTRAMSSTSIALHSGGIARQARATRSMLVRVALDCRSNSSNTLLPNHQDAACQPHGFAAVANR